MKTRFCVVYTSEQGETILATPNQSRFLFDTPSAAKDHLTTICGSVDRETRDSLYGENGWQTFEVRAVDCYDSGDAMRTVFPNKDIFAAHGFYHDKETRVSYNVQFSGDSMWARLRYYEDDQPIGTDWLPIVEQQYNGDDEDTDLLIIDPMEYAIPVGLVRPFIPFSIGGRR